MPTACKLPRTPCAAARVRLLADVPRVVPRVPYPAGLYVTVRVCCPRPLLSQVSKQDSRWGDGRQQDSQEFLNSLLEALQVRRVCVCVCVCVCVWCVEWRGGRCSRQGGAGWAAWAHGIHVQRSEGLGPCRRQELLVLAIPNGPPPAHALYPPYLVLPLFPSPLHPPHNPTSPRACRTTAPGYTFTYFLTMNVPPPPTHTHTYTLPHPPPTQSECNRITSKPVYKELQGKGSEEVQAAEAYVYARTWNDSIVDDTFGGLTQSTLQCLACKRTSHTFEPFLGLAVPIPQAAGAGACGAACVCVCVSDWPRMRVRVRACVCGHANAGLGPERRWQRAA